MRLGIEFRGRCRLGREVTLHELHHEADAVVLAVGAWARQEAMVECDGELPDAGDVLERHARGERIDVPRTAVVVGDGDEAVACARLLKRLGARQVTVVASGKRLGAFERSVGQAEAEGIEIAAGAQRAAVERRDGAWRVSARGVDLAADLVVSAPGRTVDTELLDALGLESGRRGVKVDRATLATDVPGVFAAGEVLSGASAAVRAVATGRLAAVSVDQFLRGADVVGEPAQFRTQMTDLHECETQKLLAGVERQERVEEPLVPVDERSLGTEDQGGLDDGAAVREAMRCLQCDCLARDNCKLRDYATEYGAQPRNLRGDRRRFERDSSCPSVVYESGKCILCGLCVRICAQAGVGAGMTFLRRGFVTKAGAPLDMAVGDGLPDEIAVRCAEACPTGALALKRRG
jgi:ferredoxin